MKNSSEENSLFYLIGFQIINDGFYNYMLFLHFCYITMWNFRWLVSVMKFSIFLTLDSVMLF
jgi:hypothetical protein